VTFWRSFFTMVSLLVILPLWQGRGVFARHALAEPVRPSGCPVCAGA
jgi:hypothetical protein